MRLGLAAIGLFLCVALSAQLLPTRRRAFATSGGGGGGGGGLTGGCGNGTPNFYLIAATNAITSGSSMIGTNVPIPSGLCSVVLFHVSHYNSGAGRSVSSISLNSQNATFITNSVYFDSGGKAEVWGIMNPTAGTNNATITLSGTVTEGALIVTVVTNATSVSALIQESSGTGNVGTGYTNIVTTASNRYIQDDTLYGDNGTQALTTATPPQTLRVGTGGVGASGKHTLWTADQVATGTSATNVFIVSSGSQSVPYNHIVIEVR